MLTHFDIPWNDWDDEPSPMRNGLNTKVSHRKMVANSLTSERNKSKEFKEKVSKGLSSFYGDPKERFFSNVVKKNNGCWIYKKRWFVFEKNELQPKEYISKIYDIKGSGECISHTCTNKKCVNPDHLYYCTFAEMAVKNNKTRKLQKGDSHHQSKLSEEDRKTIKKMYNDLLIEKNGKSKGIATLIHEEYPQVSLARICQIIKE